MHKRIAASALVWSASALALAGCASHQENTWYFAAAQMPMAKEDAEGKPDLSLQSVDLKFYRVKISGCSTNVDTEMLAGLYPVKPLHELFGELEDTRDKPTDEKPADPKNPKGGAGHDHDATKATAATAAGSTSSAEALVDAIREENRLMEIQCDKETGNLNLIAPNERFTVFYGNNATAMAEQVQSFADATTTGNNMARLLLAVSGAGEAKLEADAADKASADLLKEAAAVATDLRTHAAAISSATGDKAKKPAIRSEFLAAAQRAFKGLGIEAKDLKDDDTWADAAKTKVADIRKAKESK